MGGISIRPKLFIWFILSSAVIGCIDSEICLAADVDHVLADFQSSTRPWAHCSYLAEHSGNTSYSTRPKQLSVEHTLYDSKLDGNQFDITLSGWGRWQEVSETRPSSVETSSGSLDRDIWDGHKYYSYTENASENGYLVQISSPMASDSDNRIRAAHNRIVEMPNSPLLGTFPGDSTPVVKIIEALHGTGVKCTEELLEGEPCNVIEAKSPSGLYKLWVASTRGSCLIKATVHKTTGDKYGDQADGLIGSPLLGSVAATLKANEFPSTPTKEFTFELDHVKLDKVAGIWMASSAEWTRVVNYAGGESEMQQVQYHFISGDFSPDFIKLQAFIPAFHEGAAVQIEGESAIIPLRWHSGHIEPAVDDALRAKLDKEIEDALNEKRKP